MSGPREATGRQIETATHGHFLERAPAGSGPWPLLVGFHGYAQTAADLLPDLERLPGAEQLLIASVQALHTFYRGRSGEIAASWMTRFNRELAIADNVRYAAAVVDDLKRRHPVSDALFYLGFSQGVAMAYRAAAFGGHPARGLVALAADVPPDVLEADLTGFPRVLLARGDADASYPAEQMERDLAALHGKGVEAEAFVFRGGHELTAELRAKIGEFLGFS